MSAARRFARKSRTAATPLTIARLGGAGREQTFEIAAREWWEKRRHLWKDEYANVILTRFSQDVFPYIGKRPVAKLRRHFLVCLEQMQKRGVLETAHKVKTGCSVVASEALRRWISHKGSKPAAPLAMAKHGRKAVRDALEVVL